ncbi:MAG: DHH family phosphoesterase [Candidatus Woesearchaeota archaeon]
MKKEIIGKLNKYIDLIESSSNPVIIFDDDPDGLSSFLLLSKIFKELNIKFRYRIAKSKPMLGSRYVHEMYGHDIAFILDKPGYKSEFIENVEIPLVWVDHHEPIKEVNDMFYFNPRNYDDADNRSTTYWIHQTMRLFDEKHDTTLYQDYKWLASIGIIGDWFVPSFLDELKEMYPYHFKGNDQKELLFNSEIGEVIKKINFLLKGKTSKIKKRIDKLMKIKTLEELYESQIFDDVSESIEEFNSLLECAKKRFKSQSDVAKYFIYDNKESYTSYLSNNLMYFFPKGVLFVCRESSGDLKCSVRSSNHSLPEKLEEAMQGIEGTSGGHEHACGMFISRDDFELFLNRFRSLL